MRHHHENWDGTGYPDGLRGEAIPLGARVLAIVDCYDALTSDRPYRRALSHALRDDDDPASAAGRCTTRTIADAFLRIVQRLQSVIGSDRTGTFGRAKPCGHGARAESSAWRRKRRGRYDTAAVRHPTFLALPPHGTRVCRRGRRRRRRLPGRRARCSCVSSTPACSRCCSRSPMATSAAKIELPLGRSQSNLSLSHAVNFWALFALGPAEAVVHRGRQRLGAVHASRRRPEPAAPHRLQHRLADADRVGRRSAARRCSWDADAPGLAALVRTAAVVAPLYFFVNTALVAGAIALSTRQPVSRVWQRNFLWSAPSYLAGAALAAIATAASARGWFGWLALLAVPLYLVFRSYHTVVARLREEQDETRRAMDVQLATIEALALAIEAKAGCTPEHIRSIQQYAGDAGGSGRPVRCRGAGGAHGGAAARHRQHGGARAHPLEARGAHARRVRARQDSPARRRRDPAQRAVRRRP